MSSSRNYDHIFIKDLVILMSAGIYDHEKQASQRVIFNITLDVESNANRTIEGISDVVSYEDIVNAVHKITQNKHYDLLEELAEIIAQHCLSYQKVHQANISIEKPDIIKDVTSVGISICRAKP